MEEYGDLKGVLDNIALHIQMGNPIPQAYRSLVEKHFNDDYKQRAKWDGRPVHELLGFPTPANSGIRESALPNRHMIPDLTRITPGKSYENDSGWTPDALNSGRYPQVGIGGTPNVYRGPLDESAPSHAPPAADGMLTTKNSTSNAPSSSGGSNMLNEHAREIARLQLMISALRSQSGIKL